MINHHFRIKYFILLFFIGINFIAIVFADDLFHEYSLYKNQALSKLEERRLYQNPTWLKLLYFDDQSKKSQVLTDDFFYSEKGATDPKSEMLTLINGYFSASEDKKSQLVCRFPARFFWLNQFIELPDYKHYKTRCTDFLKWAKPDELKSISLLLVSGYFGNPASTFGHSLLRINTKKTSRFLDLTFNFGAMVPENEPTSIYIYKGLSGGYLSGFSDGYYYAQDLVYSRTEFRDIWDYEINLDSESIYLLMAHLWEASGNKFQYYFLTENCAYRLAELLALVLEEDRLTKNSAFWYSPVELFHRLHKIDKEQPVIQKIQYQPSFQRQLLHQIAQLTTEEKAAFNLWVDNKKTALNRLEEASQVNVTAALLSYYEYQMAKQDADEPSLKEARRQVLLQRLKLPAVYLEKNSQKNQPANRPSPATGTLPMLFSTGSFFNNQGQKGLSLQWAPFYFDRVGSNSLEGGELVVFHLDLHHSTQGKTYLKKLDFLRIRKMTSQRHSLPDESDFAWHLRLGLKQNPIQPLEAYLTSGWFHVFEPKKEQLLFGLDAHLSSGESYLAFEPLVAWRTQKDALRSWLQLGSSYHFHSESWVTELELKASYNFSKSLAIEVNARHNASQNFTQGQFNMQYFW